MIRSLLGPLLFNIFINDLIILLSRRCQLYNYADDNTLSYSHYDPNVVKYVLESAANTATEWFKSNNMQANPCKFQAMTLSRTNIDLEFEVNGYTIKSESSVKLLGVLLDKQLSFNNHISQICKKGARQINALARLSSRLPLESKITIYVVFVKSNFNYCHVVYHTCSKDGCKKLDKLTKRALRIVCNDYVSTYAEILDKTDRPMLYVNRLRSVIEQVFKLMFNLSPPLKSDFLFEKVMPYDIRSNKVLLQSRCNTVKYGLMSFKYQGASLWNSLPPNIKSCDNLKDLKDSLRLYNVPCHCGSCFMLYVTHYVIVNTSHCTSSPSLSLKSSLSLCYFYVNATVNKVYLILS